MGARCLLDRGIVARLALGIAFAGSTLLPAPSAAAAGADDAADLERTVTTNAWLKARAELAAKPGFYLVLDANTRVLQLMFGGALLRETPVRTIEVGSAQILFKSSEKPSWEPKIWSGGKLDPPANWQRTVIVPPPPDATGEEVEVTIPPTPDEAFPAPPRYSLRFEGGLTVEFVSEASPRGWWARLTEAAAALGFQPRDRMLLRLVLDASDIAPFYRSLPPDTRFLLLPG